MEKKWIVFYLTIIFVTCFGCLSRPETPKKNFVYNPNGREEFIFRSLEPNEKEKDYGLFALKRRNIDDYTDKITLPYKKYVGKRGFFLTKEPINTSSITLKYFYYPIVLENGEEYFFVVEKQSYNNSKYENLSYDSYYKDKVLYDSIIPLSVHIKNISFKEEPIVPNSTVIITSKTNYQYILNNNQFINHSTLKRIRDICNIFKNKKGLSELLVDIESEIDLILNEDKVDNKWKISVNFKNFNTLNPYIIIENGIPKFNFTVRYMAYDWLFISYYKVVADDFKWESHLLDFDREVLSRFIEESYTSVDIDKEDLSVLNNIANSKNALIRFYGKKYYSDEDIKDEEKNALKIMLKLFNFLKSN